MKTLRIKLPIGQVLIQSFIYLSLFCVAIELFARTPLAGKLFTHESYGSSHPHFETQMMRLKERVALDGKIDCIFIGNSQVLYGIDPPTVEQAYYEKTGKSIRCQNFGLGGVPPITAGPLARVLIKNFHPSLIVFGTGLWDYSSTRASTNGSIMSSPWVKYELGEFSIDGWLFENSNAYRYIFGMDRYLKSPIEKDAIDANGHVKYMGQTDLTVAEQIDYFDTILSRPELNKEQVNGLRDLLSLNSSLVKIVVIETPTNPTYYTFKRKARNLYPDFKKMLVFQTDRAGAGLWLTRNIIEIPQADFYDMIHLNEAGSLYFSRLLGDYLASISSSPAKPGP